ncbi:MAG: DUF4252 domain-containing protein [Bacteroidota bacterium]
MKRLIIILGIILLPLAVNAQPMSVRHLLRSCDPGREVIRIHLPSGLIRIASWFVDDEESRQVLRNITSLYLVASEDKDFSRESDFPSRVVQKLRNQSFEEMLLVNDQGERVTILMREKGQNRKEMVIAVDGDEDMVLYLKGRLNLQEILESEDINLGSIDL